MQMFMLTIVVIYSSSIVRYTTIITSQTMYSVDLEMTIGKQKLEQTRKVYNILEETKQKWYS